MLASRLHWRALALAVAALMAAMILAPKWARPPDIQENRALAERPSWPQRPSDLGSFRKAADPYVADRFPARPHLIGALNRLRMLFGVSGSPRVIVGRDGWLFYDDDSHLGVARGDPAWPQAQTRDWLLGLAGRTEALTARGVRYLVLTPPVKETIYPQFGPAWYKGPNPNRASEQLSRLAIETGAGDVLYLHAPIAEATRRGATTYSRHDTHWTGPGAYAGYVALMRRLQAMGFPEAPRPLSDFPRLPPIDENQPRDLALMLGVASFVDVDFPRFDHSADERRLRTTWLSDRQEWTAPRIIDTGQVGKPVLLMTVDSFSNELLPFLYSHFSRLILDHNQDGTWREDLIERYKPDLVILEVLESGLGFSMNAAPPPSAEAAARIAKAFEPPPDHAAARQPELAATAPRAAEALDAAAPANCNLESATLAGGGASAAMLSVSGWISELAPANTAPVGQVRLQGPAGDYAGPIRVDLARPDVAAFFKVAAAAQSGFTGAFRIERLPAGRYAATVYRRSPKGWIACRGNQALTVN